MTASVIEKILIQIKVILMFNWYNFSLSLLSRRLCYLSRSTQLNSFPFASQHIRTRNSRVNILSSREKNISVCSAKDFFHPPPLCYIITFAAENKLFHSWRHNKTFCCFFNLLILLGDDMRTNIKHFIILCSKIVSAEWKIVLGFVLLFFLLLPRFVLHKFISCSNSLFRLHFHFQPKLFTPFPTNSCSHL